MSNKNVCVGWQMPVSCFDCQCKILSDPVLEVLESVDWSRFLFLERYSGKGRHPEFGRTGLLRCLLFMELRRIPSVNELLRVFERDPYIMKNLGLCRLPDKSVFSKFKRKLGEHMDRIVSMLTGTIFKHCPELFSRLCVDSTKVDAYSWKDKQAGWGFDHINKTCYKGYKVHLLYNTGLLVPISYTVTSARVHDNTELRRLVGKIGPGILKCYGLLGDGAYDSKANIIDFTEIGVTVITRKNKRKAKKLKNKYRLQDYCKVNENLLNHIYKTRNDCEVTNNLLKEHLDLENTKTTGILRTRVKTGLTILARQIHVLHLLIKGLSTRTAIIN